MATIVTRSGKGSPLTNTEVDANFTNLNSDKLETSAAYVHPTGNGNNHIPSDGASGQILGYSSAGTAQWQAAPAADPTRGTLTKSFTSGETASITLSAAVSPAPVVSATKEVPQSGISSKGAWDVSSTGTNYDRLNSAYNTTLTLSTEGWDISTASYSQNFSVSSQTSSPSGVFFKPDGSKMYVIGDSSQDSVFEYNLSTAWDVSTASYSQNFSVQSEEHSPTDLFFKPDGSKMYIVGTKASEVNEYNLSTAWDISTASHNQSKSVYSEERYVQCIFFKPDGSKMYVTGFFYVRVYEYDLSTAWDISTASINQNFAVNSQDGSPMGISFKPNGTKMYILGDSNDKIYEYNLSTAWDVSTTSFLQNFSIYSQESNSRGMFFKPDGGKMYVVGSSGDDVNEYNLALSSLLLLGSGSFAAEDIGKTIKGNGGVVVLTAADGSFTTTTAFTDSSAIAAGSWSMNSVAINATDGLEMSSAITDVWDVSKAVYVQTFSVQPQDDSPTSVFFKPDGLKMYVCGYGAYSVYEYNLSTAWNISTSVYYQTFSVINQEQAPQGVFFKSDGTKMYIIGTAGDDVNEYGLSTAWDISTASYSHRFYVGSYETQPNEVFFKPDGLKMYTVGKNGDAVDGYNLSTAWDVSTASYSQTFQVASQESAPLGLFFKSDGTKMYIVGAMGGGPFEYDLSTAWDITTASYSQNISVSSQVSVAEGIFFKPDGSKMYIVDSSGNDVNEYDVGTTVSGTGYLPSITNSGGQIDSQFWTDINSMTADEIAGAGAVHYAVSTDNHATWSVIKNGSGVRPIVRNNSGTWQYNTAAVYEGYGLSNASFNTNDVFDASSQVGSSDTLLTGVAFNASGTKMYVNNLNTDTIYQYSLSSAFTVNTASYDNVSLDISGQVSHTPYGIVFSPDGTKMYHVGLGNDRISQYTLSTAFDLSTAQYASKSFDLDIITSMYNRSPRGLTFNGDGTKIYVMGSWRNALSSISLSTAYDVSTASYDGQSAELNFNSQDSTARSAKFNNDGTKLFMVGQQNRKVYLYNLSTAYNISTASYSNTSYTLATGEHKPYDLAFSADGKKMFIAGSVNNTIYQYSTVSTNVAYTTSATWANSTTNSELYALQQALTSLSINRMDKAQLEAVTDPNHYTLGDSLDLMISLHMASASSDAPSSDGVNINYDAASLIQGAVLGNDYNYDFPNSTTVRVTSSAAQNLKVRVV